MTLTLTHEGCTATACKLYTQTKKNLNSDVKKMSVKLSHSSRGSKQTHISPPENTAEEVKSGRREKKPTFGSEQGPSLCTGT